MTIPLGDGVPPLDAEPTEASDVITRTKEQIGPYRLLELVGEGGMGEVWLAEQTRPVHRQVALKVIKAGMDTAQVVARFEAERQALALMEHPAIARVFDAGATPQGRPYFAMEYVRGESITHYASRHRLSIRQRIELFIQICEGVQHAHQKGIIHRDLKPSNVLVAMRDDKPVPKIIDFGLAKAMTQALTERTLHTEFGALLGTPEYMSPEQADMSILDVDTRTDVYALGVILYELLTGVLPFDSKALREKPLDEIRRIVRDVDPPRPSTRMKVMGTDARSSSTPTVPLSATSAELRGDLDWITMRALEKERTRRYASVGDLAADLQRYLDDQPVLASPPSRVYRAGKFVRRNKVVVTAAGAIVLLLFTFATMMALQARRTARERDRANSEAARATREAETANQVTDFLVGLFTVSDPSEARGNTLTAREILDKGAAKVEKELAAQPEIQGRLETMIGMVLMNLGAYSQAEVIVDHAVRTLSGAIGTSAAPTLSALHQRANVYWYQARYDEAERLYGKVVTELEHTLGGRHRETLKAQYDLASVYIYQKRWADAERLTQKTLDSQIEVFGPDDLDVFESRSNLQVIYYRQGRYSEALAIELPLLDGLTRKLGPDHPNTLMATQGVGADYAGLKQYDHAEALFLRALSGQRRVLGPAHQFTIVTVERLAGIYSEQHRYQAAEEILKDAYARLASGDANARQTLRRQFHALYTVWRKPVEAAKWR